MDNYIAPGTVSNILWHFTGGPKWDEISKTQSTEKKPEKEAYKNIKNILRTKELRVGKYKEIVKFVIPEQKILDLDIMKEVIEKNVPKTIESNPICCVAEIPIQHLSYHAKRYGKFAIGFFRESLLNNKFSPVTYSISESNLIYHLINAYEGLIFTREDIKSMPNELDKHFNFNEDDTRKFQLLKGILVKHGQRIEYMEKVIGMYISFIKSITIDELNTIYCEREWRSLESFKFSFNDIAFIILPKSFFGKDKFASKIKKISDELMIPRHIPIIPWEDLIEQ